MKKRILIAGIVCVLALSGCQAAKPADAKKEAVTETETTVEETQPAWGEEEQMELYNSYIDVYNFLVSQMNSSIERYFNYVNYEEEFSLVEGNSDYYTSSVGDYQIEKVENAYKLLDEKTEKDALDEAFINMYPTLSDMMSCMNDIYEYTDMKSYLDDDFAKGKELHGVFWSSFNEYTAFVEVFHVELLKTEKEQRVKDLQNLKDQGMEVLYAINIMIDSAKAIQTELYNQEIFDGNILDINMETLQPLYDEFIQNVDTVLEVCEDDTKLSEEGIPIHSAYWNTFLYSMKDTKKSLTGVVQKVKEQTPLSEFDTMIATPGSGTLASFDAGISAMVSDYNNFISY